MPPDQQKPPLALIVDDDAVDRLMARAALESVGWNVEEAENGREALAIFQRLQPDVVLLDIMMPEMDGFTVCAALRKLPEGEHTPILIMTGQEDYNSILQAYDAGATDFLTKPLNGLLLTHRVRYIVRSSRALQDLRASQVSLAQSERRLRFTQFAVDHAEDGILWVDDSKRFMYANEAACRLMGYANEELLTLSISDIAPYLARYQQGIDQIKEGTAATYESVHQRKDGTEFPIEASVTILKHEGQSYICAIIRDITERKHIEEERLQALVAIENIMETVPDIMFTLDIQANLVKWNRRLVDVTGYSPEELLNKPALAFVPPEEQARTAATILQAFKEGYAELDGHLLTKDFRAIPYHVTGALLKNSHGEPIGITGIGRDVSDKKRAEEELKQQRCHLVEAQALAHLGSWSWNIESGEEVWSDEQFRIFGYGPGSVSIVYETFMAALLPDDHDRVLAAINGALLGKAPYDIECRIVRPNGEVRFIHVRGDVHRDATGHPLSMAGTVLDITERKQVEEALRASEERWQLAVRGSNDGIWDWDIQAGEIFFSSRWKAMRGFEDHEITNHVDEWRSRIHPDDLDRVLQSIDAYLIKQTPEFCQEYRVQQKDGSYMWVLDRGMALWADDGTPIRMAGSESDITDRKRAEDEQKRLLTELAESQQHFEHIFHWTPSAVAISTLAEGRLLDVNDRLVQLTGYSREELIGHTTTELQLWADPPERARVIQEILQQRSLHNKEGLLRTKFGDIRAIMVSVDRIEVNATPCLIYVAHDITERKQTEEKLRLSEQRQELALSGANLGLWDWDVSAGKAVFDARWCSMIGYAMDELEPHASTWLSLLHPEDAPAIQTILESHLKNETPDYEGEFRMRHKAGHWIWILARGRVVERDHAGAPLRMAGTHMDITDRKRAEEAIREAELRYRTIFEQAGVGVAQVESRMGQFVQVNSQYCEILGMTEAEMLATTFGAVTHPDDLKRDLESMTLLLSGEIPSFNMEKRYVRKDGSIVWVNLNVAPLWRSGETPVHHISIVQDITERKRAEDALRRSECQLRTVLDALPVGVWFTDQRGKPVLSNPAAKEIWSGIKQIRLETAANTPGWWEAIGPSSEIHRWALSHALTKGAPSLNETLHLECLDGTEKVIRNTTVPVQDEAGVVLGAIVLNEDITALRQAQEALKLTQFSVDHAVEGFFWIGPDARILNVNDAACRMLEYTRDELTTMTMHDIDPNFPPEIWSAHWEELKQKKSMTFESKHWSKTGRVLDTEVTINFLYYEGSEYNCAIMRDIGERKQVNAALRVSEDRFRSIFQNEPECVKAVAPDGTLLVMNPAGLIMVGARFEEEVIGKSVLSLIYPDDRSAFQKLHQGVCSGESGSLQFRIKSLQAEVRWVDTHSVPLRDAAGGVTAALSITRDITERKRIEETLSRRERDLRAAVEERQRISQDLHDGILQSLFAVGLGLEASKSTMPPRIRKTSGPPLDQAIKQLNRVMHEIRNFIAGLGSDLLQGKDLPAALKQMLASLTQNQAMRVRLAVEDRAAQAVSAEQSLNLFHVIQEAVSNCIRHGRAQEARVSLKMLKQGVRLSIRDDGRGFNPETAKGSGHGLSNMAARAQKIGGRFTVLSKVNEGTSIVLDLPKEASYGRS